MLAIFEWHQIHSWCNYYHYFQSVFIIPKWSSVLIKPRRRFFGPSLPPFWICTSHVYRLIPCGKIGRLTNPTGRNVAVLQKAAGNEELQNHQELSDTVPLNVSIIFVSLCLSMSVGKPLATSRGWLAVSEREAPVLREGGSDQPRVSQWLTSVYSAMSGLLQVT